MINPQPVVLASMVETAISIRSSTYGRSVHAVMLKTLASPLPSFLTDYLINMYSKLDLPASASLLLELTPCCLRSVVTWTSLISGSVQNGHFTFALLQFLEMHRESVRPNDFTLPCLFKSCASLGSGEVGKQLHALAVKIGEIGDVFVGSSAFDMYMKTRLIEDACMLFDEMPERNIVSWNAYMSNSVLDGRSHEAINAFMAFRNLGHRPDSISFCAFLKACSDASLLLLGCQFHAFIIQFGYGEHNSVVNGLIDFYGKCGKLEMSHKIFSGMRFLNDVSWSSVVAVCVQNDEQEKGCLIFINAMEEGVMPTDVMLSSALSACASLAALDMGRSIHSLSMKVCLDHNLFVGNTIVDMYGKCGSIEDCRKAFLQIPEKNPVTWNAIIGGYAHQGNAGMVLALFHEMKTTIPTVNPNYVTLVSVLTACSRAGFVRVGMEIFDSMVDLYGIHPGAEHYACMVDMLGRAGMVDQAYDFMKKMPIPPTASIWGALLGSCRVYGKSKLGKIAADRVLELDRSDSGNRVLLSNTFSASGKWEESNHVREVMKGEGIVKGMGCSWITVKDAVYVFRAKDSFHEKQEIQAVLCDLRRMIEKMGYTVNTGLALFDLEEEKEWEIWQHSERLALGFGLIVIPRGIPIRIMKNIRICIDCHIAFKFISDVTSREIIVRDNSRFHCFHDGVCSCQDYW